MEIFAQETLITRDQVNLELYINCSQAFVGRDATTWGKKENFDVSNEDPSSSNSRRRAFARNVEILLIFFRYLHPYQRKLVHINDTTYTDTDSSRLYHINCSPSFVHTGIPTLQLCFDPSGFLRSLNAR